MGGVAVIVATFQVAEPNEEEYQVRVVPTTTGSELQAVTVKP